MIVEIALKDFFDEASDTWIMDDDGTLRGPVVSLLDVTN